MDREIIRGEIYWIMKNPFEETVGSVQTANRPGIVVSCEKNNQNSETVEVVFTTAAEKKPLPTHCTINSTPKESTALCEQITTVSTEQIGDYINVCTKEEMQKIERCILCSLGFDPNIQAESRRRDEDLKQLRIELAKAESREELLRDLYNQLLEKITTKKRKTT